MRETAYAKINLALHVRGRRDDGYHDIETLFAFVDAGDVLTAHRRRERYAARRWPVCRSSWAIRSTIWPRWR